MPRPKAPLCLVLCRWPRAAVKQLCRDTLCGACGAAAGESHDLFCGDHIEQEAVIRDAVANAAVVLVPVQASALDVLGQEAAFDIIRSEGKWDRTILLWNRIDARSTDFNGRIEKVLTGLGLPMVRISQRVSYAKAGAEAKTGAEIDKAAAGEIAKLWDAIQGVLKR